MLGHGNISQGYLLITGDFHSVGSRVSLGIKYNDFDRNINLFLVEEFS